MSALPGRVAQAVQHRFGPVGGIQVFRSLKKVKMLTNCGAFSRCRPCLALDSTLTRWCTQKGKALVDSSVTVLRGESLHQICGFKNS
jgi:hypothetical protein